MANDRDYYATLQVPHNASQDEIERSYHRLSAQYDPATSRKAKAAQRYQEIQQAYETLGDRQRRREYDREVSRRRATPGSISPSEVLSNRFLLLTSATIIGSIVVILLAVLLLAGGGDDDDDDSGTMTLTFSATPTPVPTPTGPTPSPAPSTAPEVEGSDPVTLESGLQIITVRQGDGAIPTINDEVQVWYTGYLAEAGTKFDSSVDRGVPAVFAVNAVVPGFREALLNMQEGSVIRAILPAELGYGAAGSGDSIPPDSDLIFDIELLLVIRGPSPTDTPVPSVTVTTDAAATDAATDAAIDTPAP